MPALSTMPASDCSFFLSVLFATLASVAFALSLPVPFATLGIESFAVLLVALAFWVGHSMAMWCGTSSTTVAMVGHSVQQQPPRSLPTSSPRQ